MQLELVDKQKHKNTNIVSFRLESINETIDYKAGQFMIVDMNIENDDKGPTRCFTISSSPTEKYLMFTTTIRDSPFKQKLDRIKIGDTITAKHPEGEFVLPDDKQKHLVFLSGGIGVTPFRSMLKYVSDKQISNKIIVFDSNKTQKDILFKDEFDKIEKANENIKIIYTLTGNVDDWNGEKGRIDKKLLTRYLDTHTINSSDFYICGPPGMIKGLKTVLRELKISSDSIKTEEFTGY